MPRRAAVFVVFAGTIVVAAGIGLLLVPPLVAQVEALVGRLPHLLDNLAHGRGPLGFLEDRFHIVERAKDALENRGAGSLLGFTGPVFSAIAGVVRTVIGALAVTFLTLFMLLHGPRWWRAFVDAVPDQHRDLWERIGGHVYRSIGGWVIGAVVIAAIAGTAATLVLLALGVPYALPIGLIVGLLDPIPFVGATIAGVIGALITWASDGFTAAVVFAGFLLVYQQVVENHLLVPVVYGRTVELDALGVLLAVLLGGQLAGIIGAIAAVPIGGSLKAIAGEVRRWRPRRDDERRDRELILAQRPPPAGEEAAPPAIERRR